MKYQKTKKRASIDLEHAKVLSANFFPGGFKGIFSSTRGVVVEGMTKFVPGRDSIDSVDYSSMFKARPDAILREKLRNVTIVVVGDISYSMLDSGTDINKIDIVMLLLGAGFNWARVGNRVGALLFDEEVRSYDISDSTNAGDSAILELEQKMEDFEAYAKSSSHRATDIQPALTKLLNSLAEPSLIFLVSDCIFPLNCEEEFKELADMHRIVPIIVSDRTDKISLPWWSFFVAKDIESGELVCASQIEKNNAIENCFEDNDIPVIKVNTDSDYKDILSDIRDFFRNTGGFQ